MEKTGPITIEAIGVNSMQHDLTNVHVLYAKIKDENGHLQELAEKIVDYFIKKCKKNRNKTDWEISYSIQKYDKCDILKKLYSVF